MNTLMDAKLSSVEREKLWQKIESLQFESSQASFTFNKRLARENGWEIDFATEVVFEYKRFIFLTAISTTEITPSDQIDQAWHLHLTYTNSYWNDLCKNILGFDLHHNPTLGGPEEQARFRKQYSYTLSFYETVFGEKPPADIWPPVDQRFEAVEDFVRVNKSDVWIIRNPESIFVILNILAALAPISIILFTDNLKEKGILYWVNLAVIVACIYLVINFVKFITGYNKKSKRDSNNDKGGGGGCGGGGGGDSGCGGGGCGGCGG